MTAQSLWFNNGERQLLTGHWQFCATAPGAIADISDVAQLQTWQTAENLGSVAAMLRQSGEWSLDAPPRRFDAEDWWYRLSFDSADVSVSGMVTLGFEGLATLANVWLNGTLILTSNNMFLHHQVPIQQYLKLKDNTLVIVFRALDQHFTKRRPRPRWRVPMLEQQQLRWIRTTLLGRTPGWSPPAAVVGPWRNIWLEHRQAITLHSFTLRPTVAGSRGKLFICCRVESLKEDIQTVTLVLTRNQQQYVIDLSLDTPQACYTAELTIEEVALWWPHTHGEAALYTAELRVNAVGLSAAIVFDLGVVGFRSIHLQREQGAFSLQINGVPVFCRGACWSPLDPVTLDVAAELYTPAIAQVRAAGMNMLRVGGTMAYEAAAFYRACTEQGVMVWQDFMFANMDYPDDAEFNASVQQEAEQQLMLWHACPALTVLCGNSEVEQQAAMWGAPREVWLPPLFHQHLAAVSNRICPDVPYWPSSAHDGAFPHQNNVGTTSYYGVGAYLKPLEDARRAQVAFATECLAFANVPELPNMLKIPSASSLIKVHHPRWKERVPRDLGAGWDFEDVRDHYLATYFGVDPLQLRYANHERYLLLSRVVSGEVIAATFNEWRSTHSNCQGGMVWLLRDLWPGAGWGVLDSDGNPKAAYFYLKRVLQSVSLSLSNEGTNGLFVHIINEQPQALQVELNINVYKSGQTLVASACHSLALAARAVNAYPLLTWFEQFLDLSYAYRFGPALADAIQVQLRTASGEVLGEAFHFPLGLTNLPMRDLGLQASVKILADGNAMVTVQCRCLALAVYFDVDGFIPDDAYFHLAPNSPKIVIMRATKHRSLGVFGYIGAINAIETVTITPETETL